MEAQMIAVRRKDDDTQKPEFSSTLTYAILVTLAIVSFFVFLFILSWYAK